MKNLETKQDFDKILALDKFFESENKSEVQKDIDTLSNLSVDKTSRARSVRTKDKI